MFKTARKRLVLGVLSAALLTAGLLVVQFVPSGEIGTASVLKSAEGIQALQLSSITTVSSSDPASNYPRTAAGAIQNDNYGISVWTGTFPSPHTECGTLGLVWNLSSTVDAAQANIWEHRNACNGYIAVGGADEMGAQTLTITGTSVDNKAVTINVNMPKMDSVNGNMALYVDDTGGVYHCRADHNYSVWSYDTCDLTLEQALVAAHRITSGSSQSCGNNLCQTGETYRTCAADCAAPDAFDYSFEPSAGDMGSVSVGATGSIQYTLKDLHLTAKGSDTVTLAVKENAAAATWCSVSAPTLTVAGGESKTFYVTCNPTASNVGSHVFQLTATSAVNTANGSEWAPVKSTTFTLNVTQAAAPPATTCALNLTLNDGKTSYIKSMNEFVNYTYTCTPAGTRAANVTVQVVKPDGTATTYNSGTNIDTATMGFETSNFNAGIYTLRACLDSTCTTGVASVNFTVTDPASTTNTGTTNTGTVSNGVTSRPNNECYAGETCGLGSWCTMGSSPSAYMGGWVDNCYYPDGRVNCVLNAYTTPTATTCGAAAQTSQCPAGTSHCRPGENCIEMGQTGSADGWCWQGQKCSYPDGKATCITWGASCPAGSKMCNSTDTNCIEPGETGNVSGWCTGNSDQCYSEDGSKMACVKRNDTASCGGMMEDTVCPAGFSHCRADDLNCTDVGKTNSKEGAWCSRGKECHTSAGLTCVSQSQDCPQGSTLCRAGDTNCHEPETYFTYSEYEWPWCVNGMSVYSNTEWKGYCLKTPQADPVAMQNFVPKPPKGYGFCRLNDTRCLEPGEKGPSDSWCGWMPMMGAIAAYSPYATDRTCPKLGETFQTTTQAVETTTTTTEVLTTEECPVKVEAYYIEGGKCIKTKNGCIAGLYSSLQDCEKDANRPQAEISAEKEGQVCISNAKGLFSKVNKFDSKKEELSSYEIKLLEGVKAEIETFLSEHNANGTTAWSQVQADCQNKSLTWERSLDPIFKRLGSESANSFLADRIASLKQGLASIDKDTLSRKDLGSVEDMEELLDRAEECYSDKDYQCTKEALKKIDYLKSSMAGIGVYAVDLEANMFDSIAKHIEEKVLKAVEEKISQKMANFEAVFTELLERNMTKLIENMAALTDKIAEAVINATTKALENAMYIAEDRVRENFLQRMDDLTSSVTVLEEELGTGMLESKIKELNEILIGNAWSEATSQELQGDLAQLLLAKSQGEAQVLLLSKIELVIAKAEARLAVEPRLLVDEGVVGFVDAPVTRWDGGLMLQAKDECIASGRGDDPYTLDATRNSLYQETIALTIRTAGIPLVSGPLLEPVPGLQPDSWAAPYWRTLQDTGYDPGRVAYNDPTTRIEAAKLMYSLMEDKLPETPTAEEAQQIASEYKDYGKFANDPKAVEAVAAMDANGLIQGYGDQSPYAGQFGANDPMTRNMLITVMVRAADLMEVDPCAVQ